MNSNELYHYGVLGMKWGVRRYQNKDGSLTAAGKKKQEKDNKHSEYAAKRILKEKIGYADHDIKRADKKLAKLGKNMDRYTSKMDKAYDRGDFAKRDRYMDKYLDAFDKSEQYTIKYDDFVAKRDFYKRKLSEIDSGVLQAGKDYIAHYIEAYNGSSYVKDANLEFLTEKGRS